MNRSTQQVLEYGEAASEEFLDHALDNVASEDADWFATAIKPSGESNSLADRLASEVGALSERIVDKKEAYENSLIKVSRTGSNEDLLDMTRNMKDYYLEVTLVSKVTSKAVNALERLTNLQ